MTRVAWRNMEARVVGCIGFLLVTLVICHLPRVGNAQVQETTNLAQQKAALANDKSEFFEERKSSLKTLEEATSLFLSSGETVEAARTLNRIGRLQLYLYDPKKAIESHSRALRLLGQKQSYETEVDNLIGLAEAHLHLNEPEPAETAIRRAISLSQQANYKAGEAEALIALSERQNSENHLDALETGQKALALWESLGDKAGIASAYIHIGEYYTALQRLDESKQSYEKAFALWSDLKRPGGQADALIAIGFIEYRRGDVEGAISYHRQARALLNEETEPIRMGQISCGLAEAFNASGMPEIGLTYYQRGLDYYRQTQKPDYIAYAIWGIGRTHYLLKNYREAINQIELTFADERKDSLQAAQSHEFLARIYIAMGDYDTALEHLETSLPIYERAVNPKEVAQVYGLLGQVYQQKRDAARAGLNYKRAMDAFVRLDDRVNLGAIYYALGQLELNRGDLNAAETFLRQSIEVTENLLRISTTSDLTVAFSASVHERYETYIDCLMRRQNARPGQNESMRAFETSERSRGRALVELLQATQTAVAPGLDPQLAEQEKSLRQSLRVREDARLRLLALAHSDEELTTADRDIAALDAQYNNVLDTIRVRYPSFEQINRPTGWDVRQIQEKVVADNDTLLLEYSLGADRSYVWAVTRDRITNHELPSESVINQVAQKVYRLLATSPNDQTTSELDQATLELSRMILLPVAEDLNKRRILVVADGALNYIPFQVLPNPSDNREQLLVAHEIINAPSATILGQLRQETARRPPATSTLAAFGDPVFAANYSQRKETGTDEQIAYWQERNDDHMRAALRDIELNGDAVDPSAIQPLFYAKHELANLRDVAGVETLLATGFDASREKLQHTDLTKYSILHFATHGVLDPKRPEHSGLFLSTIKRDGQSQEGFVGLSDIYNLHAPVDLVVLSACRTGLGKDVRGEGLVGITRGFMYAGASSVVASLWKVDDEATAELMKQFYINLLRGGMTPASALAAAQNSIRQQNRWRSPYYWAAFTIQGDSQSAIKPMRAASGHAFENTVVAGSLLALMVIVVWSYRRHKRDMKEASG